MIQDMSYPGNSLEITSVNHSINSDDVLTAWGSFDTASALILSLPTGCVVATFDISAAYRLMPIRPDQQHHLCVLWKEQVYVDCAVMFGLASSAGVFGRIADMLVAIYHKAGFTALLKWVDDFFVIHLPGQSWTEHKFMEVTGYFGVPWSIKKMRLLATVQRYIGFEWNLESRTVALPPEKLSKILSILGNWLVADGQFSAKEAASLHEKLVHISCIFPLIRPFLHSISGFVTSFTHPRSELRVPPGVHADLS